MARDHDRRGDPNPVRETLQAVHNAIEGPRVRRDERAMNDFTQNDIIMTNAFPTLFLMGRCADFAGSISINARRHMMLQATNQFATHETWLLHVFDTEQRHRVTQQVAARVRGSPEAFAQLTQILSEPGFDGRLRRARDNPDGEDAKFLQRLIAPFVEIPRQRIDYTASKRKATIRILYALHYKYGPARIFWTFAPDESHNALVLRMCITAKDNVSYPAVVDTQFFNRLRDAGEIEAEGVYRLDDTSLHRMVGGNPVAQAEMFRHLIEAVFTVLFKTPPSSATRKMPLYDQREKGLFGTALATAGIVECAGRGALHAHGLLFGGVPASLIERFGHLQEFVDVLGPVLDSMVRCQVPLHHHVDSILRKIEGRAAYRAALHADETVPLHLRPSAPSQPREPAEVWSERAFLHGEETAAATNKHDHMPTCRQGNAGKIGCRLNMPRGNVSTTQIKMLQPSEALEVRTKSWLVRR